MGAKIMVVRKEKEDKQRRRMEMGRIRKMEKEEKHRGMEIRKVDREKEKEGRRMGLGEITNVEKEKERRRETGRTRRTRRTRKMRRRTEIKRRTMTGRTRRMMTRRTRRDAVERAPTCCLSLFTTSSGASTWPWNRHLRSVSKTSSITEIDLSAGDLGENRFGIYKLVVHS